jgi:glycosyltransferase involved in cell wall biosynthesis
LRALANRNGVGARVLFVGWVDGDEKASALRGAELFVLPSHQENFGIAAVEALACGVPVLVSEHVNLAPDIERARAGWVAPVERKAFARTLERALSNAEDRSARGNAGKTLLRTKFSWNESTRLLIELYDSAASGSVALGLT